MKREIEEFLIIFETCVILILLLVYHAKLENIRAYNAQLSDEKTDLEVELNRKENKIFAIEAELANTEKTLAETAYKLEQNKEILHFDYVGEYNITAYCCEKYEHICGTGTGITASGQPVQAGVSVAVADLETFPFGTVLYIEGVGVRIVQDTGGFDMTKIDCAVDTHENALKWSGNGKHKVYIVEVGE